MPDAHVQARGKAAIADDALSIFRNRSHLAALVAAAEARSFRHAAPAAGISHQRIAAIVARLEQDAQALLFQRLRYGVQPTLLGEVAADRARSILSVMEYADQTFNQMRDALDTIDQGGSS